MHSNYFEELIPFYVAGTLSPREAQQVEQHLRTCEECRQNVTDWRKIAGAVRANAAANISDLPPLAPMLRSYAEPVTFRPMRRNSVRQIMMPLTWAAAALMVIVFAMMLAVRQHNENLELGAGLDDETETPAASYTPTADLMATIAALSTQHTDGTEIASVAAPLNFATNTPSREPNRSTATPTPSRTAEIVLTTPAPSTPIAVVMGGSINLREGPGTNYPVVGAAQNGDRFEIIAQAGSGSALWYVVRRGEGGTAWVYGAIVTLEPENAVIPPAATIPAPPPTETPLPPTPTITPTVEPTGTFIIRSGAWTLVTTVLEDTCGGTPGGSISMAHIVIPSADGQSIVFTYNTTGTSFVLQRTTGVNVFAGTYNTPSLEGAAAVSVQITFDASGVTYMGTESVTHPSGCIVRSVWAGRAD